MGGGWSRPNEPDEGSNALTQGSASDTFDTFDTLAAKEEPEVAAHAQRATEQPAEGEEPEVEGQSLGSSDPAFEDEKLAQR